MGYMAEEIRSLKTVSSLSFTTSSAFQLTCPAPTSGRHVVGVEFKKKSVGKNNEFLGTMTLYVDDKAVGSGDFRTQTGHYALAGEGLAIGLISAHLSSRQENYL
jgi:hypothetical protein